MHCRFLSRMSAVLLSALTLGFRLAAAEEGTPPAAPAAKAAFSPEQIEQIMAPIALYPDALLAQVMMASTYPLEIVQAQRWIEANPGLKGDALAAGLKEKDWDASVKSLCTFPTVLKQMSDNLDWTQDLGDAFLSQKAEVMEATQRLRAKALEAGNLKTTEQLKVVQTEKIIVIQSSSPEVIYVPTYYPTVVYGSSWSYPTYYYPPLYPPPRPGYGLLAFGAGVVVGGAIWGDCDWGHHDVDIDVDHHYNFNQKNTINAQKLSGDRAAGGKNRANWNHSPEHRKGVNYRDPGVSQKFGSANRPAAVSRDQARGFDRPSAGATSRGSVSRPTTSQGSVSRPKTSPGSVSRPTTSQGSVSRGSTSRSGGSGQSTFSGSREPSLDRAASSRGSKSRSSSVSSSRSSSRASSGGSRGGGSRGGGGGARGGGGRR